MQTGPICMNAAGFLLLVAGWIIVVSALALLASTAAQTAFVLAGFAVEGMGLVLVFRWHLVNQEKW
ncbi:MAG: hypothetical protein ACXVZH_10465 [Terriglobales bacterium]